jgi:hypothetical protein
LLLALALLLSPGIAFAGAADELSALFVQSCLPYAGDPPALRKWAAHLSLPEVPDPARASFLNGAPGKVFDASGATGVRLALISSDDGICAVITDHAADRETVQSLEHTLTEAGATFRLVAERNDKLNTDLHHREYLAGYKNREWRILAATVRDFPPGHSPGQAMLTAGPE